MNQKANSGSTSEAQGGQDAQPATIDSPEKKSRPKFFSTIGKRGEPSKTVTADPAAARLARAIRGKGASTAKPGEKKQPQEEQKPAAPAKTTSARPAAQPARRGGFKPKHLIGIMIYLIVADLAGVWEQQLLRSSGIETPNHPMFTIGPVAVYPSTLLFLATLIILLIALARFDLVPRSLTPASTQPRTAGKSQSQAKSRDGDTNAQPGMKQGVKGANDALYQEYRQNQRYWQKRDRKK